MQQRETDDKAKRPFGLLDRTLEPAKGTRDDTDNAAAFKERPRFSRDAGAGHRLDGGNFVFVNGAGNPLKETI